MEPSNLLHKLNSSPKFGKIVAGVIIASLLAGLSTGYFLSSSEKSSSESKTDSSVLSKQPNKIPEHLEILPKEKLPKSQNQLKQKNTQKAPIF